MYVTLFLSPAYSVGPRRIHTHSLIPLVLLLEFDTENLKCLGVIVFNSTTMIKSKGMLLFSLVFLFSHYLPNLKSLQKCIIIS